MVGKKPQFLQFILLRAGMGVNFTSLFLLMALDNGYPLNRGRARIYLPKSLQIRNPMEIGQPTSLRFVIACCMFNNGNTFLQCSLYFSTASASKSVKLSKFTSERQKFLLLL